MRRVGRHAFQVDISSGVPDGGAHLDSHADTSVGGENFMLLSDPSSITTYADVAPFLDSYAPISNVPIATCATAYTCPDTGEVFVLIFHQMLYFGDKMTHSLLCPNQLRYAGHQVHDCPRQFDMASKHGITFRAVNGTLFVPL